MTSVDRKFAVISSDVHENYSFFLPMVARAWRALGWTPLCLLVGAREEWESNPKTLYALENTSSGDTFSFVRPVKGYRVGTTAQLVRLLAAALPNLGDSDYLLTADVDMIPFNKGHFLQQDLSMEFNIFGADAYADITQGLFPPKFPMCYLGATARAWRDVMGLSAPSLNKEAEKALSGRLDSWDNDEMYFASKLFSHRFFDGEVVKVSDRRYRKGKCELLIRTWPSSRAELRIDRDVWGFYDDPKMIDCHCPRPGFKNPENLKKIYSRYFPKEAAWFERYLAVYLGAA